MDQWSLGRAVGPSGGEVATEGAAGYCAGMTVWQYAQLTITEDRGPARESAYTILWHASEQSADESYSESNQTVLELLNRFGVDGWELADIQNYPEDRDGSSHGDASRRVTVYTFKRPRVPTRANGAEFSQKGESLGSQPIRSSQHACLEGHDLAESKSAESATLIKFTVYCLRDTEPADDATGGQNFEQATGRLVIECRVARLDSQADIDEVDSFRAEYEDHEDRREEIKAAAADYAASWVQGKWDVAWWRTPQGPLLSQAADLFNDSAECLRGLVEHPVADIASGLGAEGPIVPIVAGITANFTTERVTALLEGAARVCEVTGIVIGAATGAHPMVIACAKRFAYDVLGDFLAKRFERIIDSIEADRDRAADAERAAGIATRAADNGAAVHRDSSQPVRMHAEASGSVWPGIGTLSHRGRSPGPVGRRGRSRERAASDDYPDRGGRRSVGMPAEPRPDADYPSPRPRKSAERAASDDYPDRGGYPGRGSR